MNYSVTVNKVVVERGLTREQAVKKGKQYNNDDTNVGIMKHRFHKGKRIYTHLPLFYYI
jgi:hypothetical protein